MNIYISIGAWSFIIPLFLAQVFINWAAEEEYIVKELCPDERRLKRSRTIMVFACILLAMIPMYICIIYPIMTLFKEVLKWI